MRYKLVWTEVKNERRHDLLTTYTRTEAEELELQDLQNQCFAYQNRPRRPVPPTTYDAIDETWERKIPVAERLNTGLKIMFGE